MKKNCLILMLLFFTLFVRGQYSFENFPAIKYKEYKNWKTEDSIETKDFISRINYIPKFYNKLNSLTIKLTVFDSLEYTEIKIYKKNKEIQKIIEKRMSIITEPTSVYVEDINSDGLKDLKFLIPNYGCGNYNYYCEVFYLIQNKNGTFDKISYSDIFIEYINRVERDFNNDGKFEIITQTFESYKKHNYWSFNIYNLKNGKFENVNNLANYPILVPLDNYKMTTKISREKMKIFNRKSPTD
ncbi:hypothetical protein [Flavobacterium sp.]|uniref:hypothetical protein n=1 Tax=Flavobacterium sp. TaxID=239 RepID=UPI0037503067